MDWTSLRLRFLRDPTPIRLGGIATNLARISSCSRNAANRRVVEHMMVETKMFIEWSAPEMEPDTAAVLVDLQLQLAQWQQSLAAIWDDAERRQAVIEQARDWSQRILDLSGLLQAAAAK